ncbi:hypothetical protein H0H93_006475 [Arthromyces matolae]|nr:hypothetical protein H0H93_006475 [Arthromyces matolae]
MFSVSSLITLVTLSLAGVASAGSSCIAFDISWNLLALGFNGKDYNAGTQDTWASAPSQAAIRLAICLNQYTNAIYVLGADASSPSSIYIYDATAKSWSTQSVTTGNLDPASFDAILDHDTNVFYALSNGELYSLDMGLLKAANSTPVAWNDVQSSGLGTDYQPVMALAQNHIHFLDVPGVAAGSAKIFVIHFSYMQPDPQPYGNFPATHGQATSFFMDSGVQQEFAFIPDDGSATYVINVETNTTQTLTGPSIKDSLATYFASTDSLVQLSSSGAVSYLAYGGANSTSANAAASWSTVSKLPSAVSSTSSSSAVSSGSASAGSSSNTAKGAVATGTGSSSSSSQGNGAHMMSPTKWGASGLVMTEQLDTSLSSLSINDSASHSDDWDRSLILSDANERSSRSASHLRSKQTPSNSVFFPTDSDTTPGRTKVPKAEDSPTGRGKRPLSELLKLHAEKGTDVQFSSEEASRLADVLGQWINASSSPYEGEDDFFARPHDDLSIPSKRNSFLLESRPRGQSESAGSRPPSSTGFIVHRAPFTAEDDALLVKYIAKYNPLPRGRSGNILYQTLCEDVDNKWKWHRGHTWHSWRDRYCKHQAEFDLRIKKYQMKHNLFPEDPNTIVGDKKLSAVQGKRKREKEKESQEKYAKLKLDEARLYAFLFARK